VPGWTHELQRGRSFILRYGFAAVCVVGGFALSLAAQGHGLRFLALPIITVAIALPAWFAGTGPAAVSVVLCILLFDYFFVEPLYQLNVSLQDVPNFLSFIVWAVIVGSLAQVAPGLTHRLQWDRLPRLGLPIATAALATAVFIADTVTPVDIVFANFYVAVVILSARFCVSSGVRLVAAGCVALTLFSYYLSVPAQASLDGVANLLLSIAVIVLTTFLVLRDQSRELALRGLSQDLATRANALEAANKELESFAYSVSHDLRAPLRHTTGYAELLQRGASSALDEKSSRYLQMILESSRRMGNLIDDLLAFSRLGRTEARTTAVDLRRLAGEVVSELGQDTTGRDIVWKIGDLPVCYGDRSMLRLVLLNLLSNAVKFTRERAQAQIEIGSVDTNPDEVEVFVRDNGAGFDMQYANKLFGVFQRLHRMEEFEGTGIGLAVVQRVIHRHGGKVRAEAAVNQGATFYFSLPKRQLPATIDAITA
jgi:signal transduction histidine kinase